MVEDQFPSRPGTVGDALFLVIEQGKQVCFKHTLFRYQDSSWSCHIVTFGCVSVSVGKQQSKQGKRKTTKIYSSVVIFSLIGSTEEYNDRPLLLRKTLSQWIFEFLWLLWHFFVALYIITAQYVHAGKLHNVYISIAFPFLFCFFTALSHFTPRVPR